MAFTKGVWEVDAETGVTAVYLVDPANPDDRSPFTNPNANLTRLLYHSELTYPVVGYDQTVTINFVARSGPANDYVVQGSTTNFPDHNFGFTPKIIVKRGTSSTLYPFTRLQGNGNSTRTANIAVSNTGIKIYERADLVSYNQQSSFLPAMTETFRIFALRPPILAGNDTFLIDGETGRVMFGRGALDNMGPSPIKIVSASGLFSLPVVGPTIDSLGAGMRFVYPNGEVIDTLGYSGSFTTSFMQVGL